MMVDLLIGTSLIRINDEGGIDMKKLYFTLLICIGMMLWGACTSEEVVDNAVDNNQPLVSGTYMVGINLGVETPLTKGVDLNSLTFNNVYEENVIYLHKVVDGETAECIEIPVGNYECNNPEIMDECKGFRYQIKVEDNGTITITAVDINGNPIPNQSMTVSADDDFYFSSIPTRYWTVSESDQSTFVTPDEIGVATNEIYKRNKDLNKEIYRSTDTFESVSDLYASQGDLELERKCSGFTFNALFSDRQNYNDDDEEGQSNLSRSEFREVMGDNPDNWYIKVFVGEMFTSQYDMQECSGIQDEGGYYASGDRDNYHETGVDNGYYIPFRSANNGNSQVGSIVGYGYNSYSDNFLFSPTNSSYCEGLELYIYIKHWAGEGEPTEEWLTSNEGAMYTHLQSDNVVTVTVQDGMFYECGANIDIEELAAAAKKCGLIEGGSATNSIISRNFAGANEKLKKFVLRDAEVYIRNR